MVPQVELFSFVFRENWRHQKDILKLTDLYRCPVRYDFRVVRKLLGWLINFPTRDDGSIVWLQRNLSIILLYRCMRDVLDKYTQHTFV